MQPIRVKGHIKYLLLYAQLIIVTGSVKRGLIADPNCIYLETQNSTCECGTTLKLGPKVPLSHHNNLV